MTFSAIINANPVSGSLAMDVFSQKALSKWLN
jgi:hypothetical protein